MKLNALLILLQVPPLILLLIIMAVVSLVTLNNSVNDWTGQIQTHVLIEERSHIVALAENVALFTSRRFGRMTADMLVVRDYAQQLVNESLVVTAPYKTYHMDPNIDTFAEPASNRMAAGWFRLHSTSAAEQPYMDNSSALDNAWRTLPSLYQASGFGLESDGFYRAFPLSRSSTRSTMTSLCHINNTQVTGYDPRCRSWYTGAKALAAGSTSDVFYTAPYVDARTGDIVISSSAPVWDPAPDSTKLFGVAFNDISFNNLENFYKGNTILENGFPILIDDTTAQLVYYPGMSRASPQYFRGLHFGSETSSESLAFSTSFNQSAAQAKATFQTVSFTYTRNGEVWQASVSSVNGTSYLVGVVVPEADIRKPVQDVIDAAKSALLGALITIIVVIFVMLLMSFILNVTFSDTITTAIMSLVDVTHRFARGEFGSTEEKKSDIQEIYNIQHSFQNLALAVQFSNPEYFKDDVPGALKTSLLVEEMLLDCDNKIGLGKVQNNIALHSRTFNQQNGDWENSDWKGKKARERTFTETTIIPYLQRSIKAGESVLAYPPWGRHGADPEKNMARELKMDREMNITVNARRLNLLVVKESTDTESYDAIIATARAARDPAGLVAACLRHAEILEKKDPGELAMARRVQAVTESVAFLTEALKEEGVRCKKYYLPHKKEACEAVFDAALQRSIIRQGEDFAGDDKKVAIMHQHLNLALLASALMANANVGPHPNTKKAQILLAHVLTRKGEKSSSFAMAEELGLDLNADVDLLPVVPTGASVTVENLLSDAGPAVVSSGAAAMKTRLAENKGRHIETTTKTGYQFSLAWDAPVDLDLYLQTPKGMCYCHRRNVAGAKLDVDRIPPFHGVDPVENIVCDKAVPGKYECYVWNWSDHGYREPVSYAIHCRVGEGHEELMSTSIAKSGHSVDCRDTVCTFTVKDNGEIDPASVYVMPTKPGSKPLPFPPPPEVELLLLAEEHANPPFRRTPRRTGLLTLRSSMACRFGIAYFLFILLVFLVCLIVSLNTTERVKNDLRDALQNQVQRQATSLMEGAASAFGEDLATASESGTEMIAQATADVFRMTPRYCLDNRTSYYDLGGPTGTDFKPPLETHQGYASSSLQASSFYLPLKFGNASNLTASENATADTTSNLDPFFASIYGQKKDDYFMMGAGFEDNSVFRRMPARDTNLIDPNREYDPTKRGWYIDATNNKGSTIYTPPYRGASSNRWMISVASAAQSESGPNTVVGVSIVDILLRTLTNSIRNLRVLDTGKITLIDHASGSTTSPTVVADQEWVMADSDGDDIFTLGDLTKPAVSSAMQRFITQTPLAGAESEASNTRSATFGTTYLGEAGTQSVLVIPTRLSGFGDRYYFTAFVKESEVFAAFEPLLAEIQAVNTALSLILVLVWACACLVAALTIFQASRIIARPIVAIEGNVQRIVENVGNPDLTKGCEEIDSDAYESAALLAKNFNVMVQKMRESAQGENDAGPSPTSEEYSYLSSMKFVPPLADGVLPEGTSELSHLWDGTALQPRGSGEPVVL